jgi:hypothetical protein
MLEQTSSAAAERSSLDIIHVTTVRNMGASGCVDWIEDTTQSWVYLALHYTMMIHQISPKEVLQGQWLRNCTSETKPQKSMRNRPTHTSEQQWSDLSKWAQGKCRCWQVDAEESMQWETHQQDHNRVWQPQWGNKPLMSMTTSVREQAINECDNDCKIK